jgi:hypothetical protein
MVFDIKLFYDQKYSSFSSVPGFKQEGLYCNRIINWLKKISWWPKTDNLKYLDVGCGFGLKTYIFSSYFHISKGIDFIENVIKICNILNEDGTRIEFECKSIEEISNEKYDFVTAFVISFFNTEDIKELAGKIEVSAQSLLSSNGQMLIGTRTNFLGTSTSGWYYLTRADIKLLRDLLIKSLPGYEIKIIAPDNHLTYLLSGNIFQFLGSLRKVLLNKPRDLFILIRI